MTELDQRFDDWRKNDPRMRNVNWPNGCCPGCLGGVLWKLVTESLGDDVITSGTRGGPCIRCASPVYGGIGLHFDSHADVGVGIAAALEALGRTETVLVTTGDGGLDISFHKVSAAAERNDDIILLVMDNEAYMNTGIQRSGATPFGAWTTTTPTGKTEHKKLVTEIMAAHRAPYVATMSPAYPQDVKRKFVKAKGIKGFRYMEVMAPCPTGWRFPPEKAIEVSRLVVETWIHPLYEIEAGVLKLSVKPKPKPVKDYIRMQRRFRTLSDDFMEQIQVETDRRRERLLEKDGQSLWL